MPRSSIRLRLPTADARLSCANAPNAPNKHSVAASVSLFGDCSPQHVLISSLMPVMQPDRNPLLVQAIGRPFGAHHLGVLPERGPRHDNVMQSRWPGTHA